MIRLSLILTILVTITSNVLAQQADEIIGKYHLPNELNVEIYKDGDTFSGKIIALNNYKDGKVTTDVNNPDKSKRDDPLIGMVIIHDLEYDKDENQWTNGKMYGPEKGMIFNLKITEFGENYIEVVGSKYFFWRTMKWEKIK